MYIRMVQLFSTYDQVMICFEYLTIQVMFSKACAA